jgi:Salmonella virulence plasmid 65kDa B protein
VTSLFLFAPQIRRRTARQIITLLSVASLLISSLAAPFAQAQSMATAGQFAVSPSGAATYSIPIQVPPGIAGMEPRLSLNYSSQAGNGLLGVGWSLGGLSSITRCAQTQAQDGKRGAINLDTNDRFCMDGQRLMLSAGSYGVANSEYRTEIESFSKVSYSGTNFSVQSKAGLTMLYIPVLTKGVALTWGLSKITDVAGNYLTVSYNIDSTNNQFSAVYL